METVLAVRLLFLFFAQSATMITDKTVWKNLGPNECFNMRGKYETCGLRQFCSDSEFDKGCRNCSDISEEWCRNFPDEFPQKYPSCEVECAEKKIKVLEQNNSALFAEVTRLQEKLSGVKETLATTEEALETYQADLKANNETLQKLRDESGKIFEDAQLKNTAALKEQTDTIQEETRQKWIFMGVSGIFFLILILFAGGFYSSWRALKETRRDAPANPRSTAKCRDHRQNQIWPWLTRLLCCLKGPNPLPIEEEQPMEVVTQPMQLSVDETTDVHPSDSGQGSEVASDRTSANSSASDVRVVAGGTDHNPSDTKDFMIALTMKKGVAASESV